MSNFMMDYREEVKRLISELYEPADFVSKEFEFTTAAITERLSLVIPAHAVDEHLVYECLTDLGFKPSEHPEERLVFMWYFKRKFNL